MWSVVTLRLRRTGLVGPSYAGLTGKLRLMWEHFVVRTEVVLIATPATLSASTVLPSPGLRLAPVENFAGLGLYQQQLDASYYPGFSERWRAPFTWGETLIVGLRGDRMVAFTWIQWGAPGGSVCHYGCIMPKEARILRAGVLPAYRGQGLYAAFNQAVLGHLFASGVERAYIDCYRGNIPAFKAQVRAGFKPVGLLQVVPGFRGRPFVRWRAYPHGRCDG